MQGTHDLTQATVKVLRNREGSMHLSDLRLALPSPRPGYVELERLLLIREDLFSFEGADQVVLTPESMEAQSATGTAVTSAFATPEPGVLIGYYEECVREEGRVIRAYGSHIGSSAMETETEWVCDERGVYSIPVSAENRELILNNSDGFAAHYYGYPVLAQWVKDERLMKFVPILFWKLDRIGDAGEVSHRLSFIFRSTDYRHVA